MSAEQSVPIRKYVYRQGPGANPRIHPPVVVAQEGEELVWENRTSSEMKVSFPNGEDYLVDASPLTIRSRATSDPRQVKEGALKEAFDYRVVQVGKDGAPNVDVHGNSHPIIIIR